MLVALMKQTKYPKAINEMIEEKAVMAPPQNELELVNLFALMNTFHVDDPVDIGWGMWVISRFMDEGIHSKVCPSCRREIT